MIDLIITFINSKSINSLILYSIFKKSSASEDNRVIWKGRLIFFGFILFLIGGILDSVVKLTPITLLLTRMLLVASSIISYFGWIMPDRVANWLVKEFAFKE